MNAWLHRISHCSNVSYKLLENGYLSIGFSQLANEDFLNNILNSDNNDTWAYFENKFIEVWGRKQKSRHNLWRFLNDFKEDDLVLVPSWGQFSIYRLVGKPTLLSNINLESLNLNIDENIDLGFIWNVKPLSENILRKDIYNKNLTAKMKIRNTNINISDLKQDIEQIIKNHNDNSHYSIHANMVDSMTYGLQNILTNNLDPDKFEKLVKWYFQKVGATDVYIPAKNENGKEDGADADIIATFEAIKVIIYVQVKYHTGETDKWAIEQIAKYKSQKENNDNDYTYIPWVITCADKYSDEAIEVARKENVILINKSNLSKMLIDCGIENIDDAF